MSIPAGTETGKKDPTYKLPILKGQLEITVSPETAFVLPVFGFIGERYQGYPKVPDDQPIPNRDFLAGVHPTLTIDGKTVLSDANKAAYYLPKTDFHPIVHYETPHDNGAVGAVFFQGVAIVIPPLSTGVHKIRLYEPAPIFGVTFDNTWIVTVRPE